MRGFGKGLMRRIGLRAPELTGSGVCVFAKIFIHRNLSEATDRCLCNDTPNFLSLADAVGTDRQLFRFGNQK